MTRVEKMEVADTIYRLAPGEGALLCLGKYVLRVSNKLFKLNDVDGLSFYQVLREVRS